MHNDNSDLVRLFGLSREEAAGLGLAGTADGGDVASPGQQAHGDTAHTPAARDEEPGAASGPGHALPGSLDQANGAPPNRPLISRGDEEAAMLALLDGGTGRASGYDGFGAARGLSLTNLPSVATPLHGIWTSDSAASLAGNNDDSDHIGGPPNQGPSSMECAADDLAALFDLSHQEALGLGLASRGDDNLPSPGEIAGGPAPTALNTLGTMPLCAASSDDALEIELSSPWDGDRVVEVADAPLAFAHPAEAVTETGTPATLRWDGHGTRDAAGRPPTSALAGSHGINPDLLDAYAEESAELLDGLLGELERLEGDADDHGALLEIRRIVHTLKGGAKMCGFEAVVKLTHSCENLLDLCADGIVVPDRDTLRTLFESAPLLSAIVQDALAGRATDMAPVEPLVARFDALCERASRGQAATDDTRDAQTALVTPAPVEPAPIEMVFIEPAPVGSSAPVAQDADRPVPAHPMGDGMDTRLLPGGMDTRLLPGGMDTRLLSDGSADTRLLPELPAGDRLDSLSTPAAEQAHADVAAELFSPTPFESHEPDGSRDAEARIVPPWLQAPPAQIVQAPPPDGARPARRGTNSINVDLTKVDAVVAKITEMAAHRVSSQGMLGKLLEYAEDARRNMTRLRGLVMQLGNECAGMQPEDVAPDDDLNLEAYTALNTIVLQLQEAVLDQQSLVQTIHDTITSQWSLQAMESRADADIQSALMSIRLVPIANMRVRLDGVVRQAAEATGKRVRWQLQGGNVAVEKNVFDRLFEPLMHLLRNGVDHGIETAGARRDAGKPETGAITVAAAQEGSQIVITVADDGAGISPNRLAALAVERGLITAVQAAEMSYQQKMALIFTPGFSTADAVSHLSGRGVGMDTVREACLRMGGSIEVSSRPGLGTTFTLRLPLSMSVTRGLIIRDGGCVLALPVAQVIALHLVAATDIVQTEGGRIARIEGQELPVFNLPPLPGATASGYIQNGEVNVLQVSHDSGSIGLVIEDVIGEEEILVKAAPALLQGVKPLLGAHVLPDGKVAPVINLPHLLVAVRPLVTLHTPASETVARDLTVLVVDDSMSMRVALTGTLQSAGFKVLTARDGQEALDVLKREGLPNLITLDVEMPRMDGLETLFAIRQISGAVDLPVFMMTSRGGSKHRRAAEQLGASRYFTKPYRDSDLANAAREACAQAFTA